MQSYASFEYITILKLQKTTEQNEMKTWSIIEKKDNLSKSVSKIKEKIFLHSSDYFYFSTNFHWFKTTGK